jgi:glucose-1-phosphate thymidylyltransferase
MYLGDNMLKQGVTPSLEIFTQNNSDCVVGVAKVTDPSRYGVVVFEKDGRIKKLIEKPKESLSNWALIGIYVFSERIYEVLTEITPSWRGELEITDVIQTLLERNAKIDVQYVQGWWKDTGRPEDLLEANQLVLQDLKPSNQGVVENGSSLSDPVAIGEETVIHDRVTIRGPAIIGDHCEIGPNVYIGPYTSIGDDVIIRSSEIENSIVMDKAYIDCGKRIIDSLIGSQTKIISSEANVPKGHKLILGDMNYVSV